MQNNPLINPQMRMSYNTQNGGTITPPQVIKNNPQMQMPQQTQVQNNWGDSKGVGLGASDWANIGLGAAGTIANIALGYNQLQIAKKQQQMQKEQMDRENQRYEDQKKRHIKATNDAVATASNLKSASSNMSKELPMQRE